MPVIIETGFLDFVKGVGQGVDRFFKAAPAAKRKFDKYGKDSNEEEINYGSILTKSSIMKASKDLVMSFPVLCSDSISIETAMMTTKAIERNCVSALQMLLSASYLKGADGAEVIKKFHNNMGKEFDMDEMIALSDKLSNYADNAKLYKDEWNNFAGYVKGTQDEIREAWMEQSHTFYPFDNTNSVSIGEFVVYGEENDVHFVTEANKNRYDYTMSPDYYEPTITGNYNSLVDNSDASAAASIEQKYKQMELQDRRERENMYNQMDNADRSYDLSKKQMNINQANANRDYKLKQQQADRNQSNANRDYKLKQQQLAWQQRTDQNFYKAQLLDTDVKKANELQPSLLIVRYTVQGDKNDRVVDFIAGVKARLIAVNSQEIIDHVRAAKKTEINKINFVRATTGEISFCKDFITATDQAKIDAKNNTKLSKTSQIWRMLQARSHKSVANRLMKTANTASAITTLVIEENEVNTLKTEYDINLYNESEAIKLLETYNLMGLVIVSEGAKVAKFLMDGDAWFNDYSFDSLQRENGDGTYKKMINLLSKAGR